MTRIQMTRTRIETNRRRLLAGAAATAATIAAPAIVRAAGGPLKVGVILPRSGLRPASARTASAASISPRRSSNRSGCRN